MHENIEQSTTGFAIIGTGAIAHIHAEVIKQIENAVLVGVHNRTKFKADAFADQHECIAYDKLEEMLKNENITIVCICTASGAHLEPAIACINAKKHCLIEKPLEITVERCRQIISAAETNNVRVATIFPSRFHPASLQIKRALDGGHFGDLVLGNAYVKWSRDDAYYNSADWRGTWSLDGGGALMNQGIHALDLLQWYMGSVESVFAFSANRRHKNIEVEDTLMATIKFNSGALGSIECTTAAYPGSLKKIEITGTSGSVVLEENDILKWDFKEDTMIENLQVNSDVKLENKGGVDKPMNISNEGHLLQIKEFLASIKLGTKSLLEGSEGITSIEIINAIYKSVKLGTSVQIRQNATK